MSDKSNTKLLCIAHRGARSLAPENTLAAARKALDVGADMWELDVGVTSDGELIIFHDDSLAGLTDAETVFPDRAPWTFTTFTLSELKKLDTGSKFIETDPFGTVASGLVTAEEEADLRGEPIPTLRQALLFTRDHNWRVNVEVKKPPPPMDAFPVLEAVVGLIKALDMVEQVLLSSFNHSLLQRAKAIEPALATAALLGFYSAEPITWPADLAVDAFHPRYTLIDDAKIRELRQAGFAVNPWTVNDTQQMQRLIQAGVTGIITDFPQILAQLI